MARRIVADVGPRFVFLENVPDVVGAGWLPHVLADLADLGFDAQWGLLSAAAVGAPHRRERFWLLASRRRSRTPTDQEATRRRGAAHTWSDVDGSGGADVADPLSGRRDGRTPDPRRRPQRRSVVDRVRCVNGRHPTPGIRRATPDRRVDLLLARRRSFPPPPDDLDGWQQRIGQGGPQPQVRRRLDGRPVGLADALHLGGNGLVPAVAAPHSPHLASSSRHRPVPLSL